MSTKKDTYKSTPLFLKKGILYIKTQKKTLLQGGAYLTVTWKALFPHKEPYWVGMYLQGDDIGSTVPIKYQFIDVNATAFHSTGEIKFWAVNMRKSIVFNLFRGEPESPTLIATSNVVTLRAPNEPTGGRLVQTADPSGMRVRSFGIRIFVCVCVCVSLDQGHFVQTFDLSRMRECASMIRIFMCVCVYVCM